MFVKATSPASCAATLRLALSTLAFCNRDPQLLASGAVLSDISGAQKNCISTKALSFSASDLIGD